MKVLLILLAALLLTACSTVTPPQAPLNQTISWQARQQQLTELNSWKIHGAVAIRDGKQAENASIYFMQNGADYRLEIYGPLGIGRNTLIGNANEVTLQNSSGKTYEASTPEELMQQQLGWSLPISNLKYWVRALPAPGIRHKVKFDQYHHIIEMQQQGWMIIYNNYGSVKNLDLPTKIRMQHGDNIRAVLVISSWEI